MRLLNRFVICFFIGLAFGSSAGAISTLPCSLQWEILSSEDNIKYLFCLHNEQVDSLNEHADLLNRHSNEIRELRRRIEALEYQ